MKSGFSSTASHLGGIFFIKPALKFSEIVSSFHLHETKSVDCLHSNINSIFFCQSEVVSQFSEKVCSLARTLYCGENIAVGYGLQYILNETWLSCVIICFVIYTVQEK